MAQNKWFLYENLWYPSSARCFTGERESTAGASRAAATGGTIWPEFSKTVQKYGGFLPSKLP